MSTIGPFNTVKVDIQDSVALITMNRPEKLNALNAMLQDELARAFEQAAADSDVRAIILTGSGRAFCAGIDLAQAGDALSRGGASGDRLLRLITAMSDTPQPIIAAINGFAVTGGFEAAMSCDILVASREARFADTHGMVGVMPGWGLSQKLARIVGRPRAMAISLTGEYIDAQQAYDWGLISHLVEPEELLPTARRLAGMIRDADPGIIAEIKAVIRNGHLTTLGEGLRMERAAHDRWMAQHDPAEIQTRRTKVMERARTQV